MQETPRFSVHDFDGLILNEEFLDKIYAESKKTAPKEDWGILVGKPIGEITEQDLHSENHTTKRKISDYQKKYPNYAWISSVSEMPKKELGIEQWLDLTRGTRGWYMRNPGIDIFQEKAYSTIRDIQTELNKRKRGEKVLVAYHTHVYDFATLQEKEKTINMEDVCRLSEADTTEVKDKKRFFWPSYINEKQQFEGRYPTLGLGLGVFGIAYHGNFFVDAAGRPKKTSISENKFRPIGLSAHKIVPTFGMMTLAPSVKQVKLLLVPKSKFG